MSSFTFNQPSQALIPRRLNQGKILIVDAAQNDLLFFSQLLTKAHHQIEICEAGRLALKKAIAAPPDLIISDIHLAEMNGYELCDRFKSHPKTEHVPFIFISEIDDLEAKARAFSVGANDYITKPFDPKEVLLRVSNHLQTQRLYLQLAEQNRLLQAEIARRKQAEQQSKLAEEKFTKAFYSSPNPSTITLLKDGTHIEVNESFCQLTGYTAEEMIGRSAVELGLWVNLDDRERLFQLVRQGSRVQNHEFEFCTKHGKIRTAILSCEVIQIDGQDCLLSLSNDISERKQAESRLQVANSTLQKLAGLDGLTKIANRRRFDSYLKNHWQASKTKGLNLSLVLCDVDHFKKYNDYYGHLQGDACLIQLAKILRTKMPTPTDFVARYGGEEFAIILPGRSPEAAKAIIQDIWDVIQRTNLPHAASPTAPFVTLSFGCSAFTPDGDIHTSRQLIGSADAALYQAKQRGRNQIAIADD
ncbi:MAG: diguanylate cyclase [Limnothrix sp.]